MSPNPHPVEAEANPVDLKESGNAAFKDGNLEEALSFYTQALTLTSKDKNGDLAVLYKNRAAVHLKNEDYQEAVDDCQLSLDLVHNDPKALFRRAQAYEALDQVDLAYNDAREVHRVDPKNKAIEPMLMRLHKAVSEKVTRMNQVGNKVKSMFEIVFDPSVDKEKREKGADNLVYLARERSGAEVLMKEGVVKKAANTMKMEKSGPIRLSLIRCVGELCKKSELLCREVLAQSGIPFFLDILNTKEEDTINAASYVIQMILDTLSDAKTGKKIKEMRKEPRKMSSADRKFCNEEEGNRMNKIKSSKELMSIFNVLVFNLTSRTLTGHARDAIVELIMKNCKYDELNWAEAMLKTDAYERMMEIASEMNEYQHESSMEITDNTRAKVGVCLAFCYEAMYDDKRRNACLDMIGTFVSDKLRDLKAESRIRCVTAITTLLQYAVELGQSQLTKDGVLPMIIHMAKLENEYLEQLVASEAIIAAVQKKKDSNMIVQQGIDVLKELYNSKNDHIKVRALVGMCKLGPSSRKMSPNPHPVEAEANPVDLKESGNAAFKDGNLEEALSFYTQALTLTSKDKNGDLAVLYKNRAAVHLKNEDYQEAVDDCQLSLDLVHNDPKALFRRAQAYEALDQVDLAYNDAREVHRVDPKNKAIEPMLMRLHKAVSEKVTRMNQVGNKVKSMFEIVFDPSVDKEKREKGADNLVYLARERSGAEVLMKEGVVKKAANTMKMEKSGPIRLSLIRCVGELCKKSELLCREVLAQSGIPFFLDILNTKEEDTINAASYVIQMILDTLSDAKTGKKIKEMRKEPRKMSSADRKFCNEEEGNRMNKIKSSKELMSIFNVLVFNLTSRTLTGHARDAIVELIMKNCKYDELNWAEAMLKTDAYERMMEIASEMNEYQHESSMEITDNTRAKVGVCLAFCYEAMYDDKRRNACLDMIGTFVSDKLRDLKAESRIRCVTAITTLLQYAVELGQSQLTKDGVLPMIIHMAKLENEYLEQLVASEAIIAAVQKKKDSNMIVQQGIDVLKELYNSKNDHIKVRALVGMCKLGASAGHDASMRPFAEGSTVKLAEACRRFLINPGKDRDLRRWAAEGLSFLTLDADVKEKLCEDQDAIKALVELAQQGKYDVQYALVTLLVNLTNSYEKREVMPEMVELAKFAKHHIPQDHELDDQDFVDKRIYALANYGVTSALVALSKTDSNNIKELIARVMCAICKYSDLRGLVVQQGGSKALVALALEGNEMGKRQAAQALCRIGITQDPSIAFPGQRLLNTECEGLENFEALLALGNLASMNEPTRCRILKESEFVTMIEGYMFEEHSMIRRAAVQCFTNLCQSPLHVKRCEGKNDKVKYIVLLCGDDEDLEIVRAASGALAMLTGQSEKCCQKVFESTQWADCILNLLANPDLDIVLRGVVIVRNMISASKEVAEKVIETQAMDCMQAHIFKAKLDEGSYEKNETLSKIRDIAESSLVIAHKYGLVKTQKEAQSDPKSDDES
eukprot:snap_masked-scaffold225_size250570-processed-gene-1.3 protein:Tk01782 transcript:snap_masked-scaffold225_size250570-processed-gene-1.3-mRNA-1 annotation:"protein unc-45 homolog b"